MTDTFGIGDAVKELQDGKSVARAGWNGKNMFLVYRAAAISTVSDETLRALDTVNPVAFDAYVMMRTAQGSYIPWLCSQADLLATDWTVVA